MNKPYLIVIEGQDRTGKDTLINNLVEKYGFYCYKQQEHEKTGVDYRNKEQYEKWVYNHIDKIYNDLLEISKTNKIILLSRLWISDNVYSDLFGRNHIVEKYFKYIINNGRIYKSSSRISRHLYVRNCGHESRCK